MHQTIGIFSSHTLPHIGGVEVFTSELSQALEAAGIHVVVVTNNIDHEPSYEKVSDHIEIFRLPCFPLINGRFPIPKLTKTYRQLLHQLKQFNFSGILINTRFYPLTLTALRIAKSTNTKVAILDHGSDYLTFNNTYLDYAVKAYEHGITALTKLYRPRYYGISQKSSQWLKTFGITSSGVISNAIDAQELLQCKSDRSFRNELGIPHEDTVVSYTGRLIPEKGIPALLEAANKLNKTAPHIQFIFAGEGSLTQEIQNAQLSTVSLVGRLSKEDISALLQESDIFCFPSRSEGFGNSLLEAAVCGNALISTDVGIAGTLIPSKEYGTLLPDNPSWIDIAESITTLTNDAEYRKILSENSALRARSLYSWENTVSTIREIFNLA